jgi:hypothetical protein
MEKTKTLAFLWKKHCGKTFVECPYRSYRWTEKRSISRSIWSFGPLGIDVVSQDGCGVAWLTCLQRNGLIAGHCEVLGLSWGYATFTHTVRSLLEEASSISIAQCNWRLELPSHGRRCCRMSPFSTLDFRFTILHKCYTWNCSSAICVFCVL